MANEYAVNQADLAAVADAIRSKGGTSDALEFPDGFVDAVGAIQAGGNNLDTQLISNSLTEYTNNDITSLAVSFGGLSKLKKVSLPKCKTIPGSAFNGCSVTDFNLPAVQSLPYMSFANNSALKSIVFPGATSTPGASIFSSCTALEVVDFHIISNMSPGQYPYTSCRSLKAFILRKSDGIVTLGKDGIFANTPLGGLNGTYSGHVYVPAALIPTYQTATNWATIYAKYPEIFQPIEGSEYE